MRRRGARERERERAGNQDDDGEKKKKDYQPEATLEGSILS